MKKILKLGCKVEKVRDNEDPTYFQLSLQNYLSSFVVLVNRQFALYLSYLSTSYVQHNKDTKIQFIWLESIKSFYEKRELRLNSKEKLCR